jgi:hypothetical protein
MWLVPGKMIRRRLGNGRGMRTHFTRNDQPLQETSGVEVYGVESLHNGYVIVLRGGWET